MGAASQTVIHTGVMPNPLQTHRHPVKPVSKRREADTAVCGCALGQPLGVATIWAHRSSQGAAVAGICQHQQQRGRAHAQRRRAVHVGISKVTLYT